MKWIWIGCLTDTWNVFFFFIFRRSNGRRQYRWHYRIIIHKQWCSRAQANHTKLDGCIVFDIHLLGCGTVMIILSTVTTNYSGQKYEGKSRKIYRNLECSDAIDSYSESLRVWSRNGYSSHQTSEKNVFPTVLHHTNAAIPVIGRYSIENISEMYYFHKVYLRTAGTVRE